MPGFVIGVVEHFTKRMITQRESVEDVRRMRFFYEIKER